MPDFTIFVVWSASYVLVASLRRGGSFPSSGFYGQLAGYYSHDFSVIHPANEFSFKEMRTWGQFKISFCCLSVRCKSGKMGVGRVQDSPMVESFSADLPDIASYWTESHLEFHQTSTTELPCESMWSIFR